MSTARGPGNAQEQELTRLMDDAYGGMLSSLCRMMLHDYHRAQDAVQETYIKAFRHLHQLASVENEKAWLIRIAINCCRDMMRTAWFRHVARSVDLTELPEIPAPAVAEDDGTILELVASLSLREREVLLLHYWQDLDPDAIAHALSINRATVYRRLERARQHLKLKLLEGGLHHD